MRKINFILLTFLVFSCQVKTNHENIFATTPINKIIDRLQNQTVNDKKLIFGDVKLESSSWHDHKNNVVKKFSFTKKETKFYEFLPIISYFLPQNYQNHEIVITFDRKNDVLDVESFFNKIQLKSAILCNEPKKSCISKIE